MTLRRQVERDLLFSSFIAAWFALSAVFFFLGASPLRACLLPAVPALTTFLCYCGWQAGKSLADD